MGKKRRNTDEIDIPKVPHTKGILFMIALPFVVMTLMHFLASYFK